MGGVSACGAPGTPAGTPEPCPTAGGERAWERYRPGRHPRDGRRLHVRGTRHACGHAGAVPYSGRRARLGALQAGEASSRRAASPRAGHPARP